MCAISINSYDCDSSESKGKKPKPTPLPHMRLWSQFLTEFNRELPAEHIILKKNITKDDHL